MGLMYVMLDWTGGQGFDVCHAGLDRSTDSQLKLWNLSRPNAINTFTGHINEKNFVGLATDGDYVLCGESFCL